MLFLPLMFSFRSSSVFSYCSNCLSLFFFNLSLFLVSSLLLLSFSFNFRSFCLSSPFLNVPKYSGGFWKNSFHWLIFGNLVTVLFVRLFVNLHTLFQTNYFTSNIINVIVFWNCLDCAAFHCNVFLIICLLLFNSFLLYN